MQLRTQEALPESGLLIAVSWRPAVLPDLRPINVQQRGSAAANACFRLLKYQPQRHHLWPLTSLCSSPPPPAFPIPTPTSSPQTSVQPRECFHPPLHRAIRAPYNLHLEPYHTLFTPSPIYCHSLSPPSHHTCYCLWVIQSAVCLVVCVTEEGVRNVPLVVSVTCVLLMELVEDAPRHWSQTWCALVIWFL